MLLVIVALLPLLAALLLLVLRCNIGDVGWAILALTIALASVIPAFYRTPEQVALSFGEGMATMLGICLILLPLLFLFQIQQETGAIDILVRSIAWFAPDRDLQTLLLVLGIGPCIESLCGSGSGAIAILPLLAHLHRDKLKAIQLSLLSQIVGTWGGLGLGTSLVAHLAGLSIEILSIHTALLLFPSTIGFSLLALQVSGGKEALERYWGIALFASGLLMVVACFSSQFFMTKLSGALASGCVIALFLIRRHLNSDGVERTPYRNQNTLKERSPMLAFLPYFLLTIGIFATRLIPSVRVFLQTYAALSYPAIKLHMALLYNPGVWVLLAALLHIPLFPLRKIHLLHVQAKVGRQILPSAIAMASFLATTALMKDSGMIAILGRAIAMFGKNSICAAPLIGGAGGWLTGTPLGTNALAVPLVNMSAHIGLSLPWLIAATNASAAITSAASPWRIILLVSIVGIPGKEALALRKIAPTILWSLMLTALSLVWFISPSRSWDIIVFIATLLIVNVPLILIVRGQCRQWLEGCNAVSVTFPMLSWKRRVPRFRHVVSLWMLKLLAYGGLLLINVLYASFSFVSIGSLSRIDPVVFLCFQMVLLVPVGLIFLIRGRAHLSRNGIHRGLLLGGLLSAELLCYTHSLKNTGITEAMVFSTVNGVVATLIAWKVFGQRISTLTRWACLFALGGACLVWYASPTKWQGDFTAFVSGVCLTGYSFQIEQLLVEARQKKQVVQPIMGVQFLTMGLATLVIALCFGQWDSIHLLVSSDLFALVYLSFVAILVPCFLILLIQRTLSTITVAFFSVVEPLFGACIAFFFTGERLPMLAYVGGGIVIVGIVLQAMGETSKYALSSAPPTSAVSSPE